MLTFLNALMALVGAVIGTLLALVLKGNTTHAGQIAAVLAILLVPLLIAWILD